VSPAARRCRRRCRSGPSCRCRWSRCTARR
jgi:hypothetical protein